MSSSLRWVVFDYGKVISRSTAALPTMASMLGTEPERFEQAYHAERDRYDRGCTDREYWQAIGNRLGIDVDDSRSRELTEVDTHGWLETAASSLRLLDDLHQDGVTLALLSNAPSSFARAVERQPWARRFRHLLFSGDLKLAKPDAEIWRTLLTRLDARPMECLFFDDRQDNIDGALQAGMHAELWRGAEHARQVLQEHGVLPT
jgi:putative hydrolase of the HAD superfamily